MRDHFTRRRLLIGLLPLAVPGAFAADLYHLPPVDESEKDASFHTFRQHLLSEIGSRDAKQLLAIAAPDILNSFGGDGGTDEFRETWGLDRPADSKVWGVLETALRLGCVHYPDEAGFVAPYVFGRFPAELDAFSFIVVIRADAALYAEPSAQSPILAHLQWDIVEPLDPGEESAWRHVQTAGGRTGYIRSTDVRSPIDYRAIFAKRSDTWLMTTLVAGD